MLFDTLHEISDDLIATANQYAYVRAELFDAITPHAKNVTILKGARGIGKSTLIQQFLYAKKQAGHRVFYVSADSTLLNMKLAELAQIYRKRGGEYLAIDEIHRYANWQAEIKTILDAFPEIQLIVSGSSSLSLDYAIADLSRRHVMYHAKGLSFREYTNKNYGLDLPLYSLAYITTHREEITHTITSLFRTQGLDLLAIFKAYLRKGYFLTQENYRTEAIYYDSLTQSINSVIDSDISAIYPEVDNLSRDKIKRLLKHIATQCPFTPNIAELSRHLNIANDNTLKKYLYYLSEGEILMNLYASDKSHKDFQKPQKIFLDNTNFAYAYHGAPLIGTIRETFVANCLNQQGILTAPTYGDFCLDGHTTFEVEGKSKNKRQIKSIKNSYVLADDVLSAAQGKIPLWLLGFLW